MADGSVIIDTKLDQSGLRKGLASLGGLLVKGISAAVASAGTALAGLGVYAFKVGSDFEKANSQIAATMGKSVDEITDITAKAKEMGASTSFSATEAAEGFNILAMSGLDAAQQIAAIEPVLRLAEAGTLDMGSAASYVIGSIKGFGKSCDDARYFADLIAKGATLASTDVNDLGLALSGTAATANSYKQSSDSVTLSLLRLAEQNVTGSRAATALNRAMMDLYTPTDQAKKVLDDLGVSAYDANHNARDFNDVIDDLNAALSGYNDEQRNAYANTIFTSQGLNAFNKMTVSSAEKIQEFKDGLAHASDGIGSAAKQAETMLDNLQGDITILKSATEGFGIALYDVLNGVGAEGDETVGMMRSLVKEAQTIMSDLKTAVETGGFDGLVTALGGALSKAVSKIAEYIPMVADAAVQIASSLVEGLTSSAGEIANAAASLIPILVEGIAGITNDLIILGADLIVAICEGLSENAGDIVSVLADGLTGIVETIGDYLPDIAEAGIALVDSFAQGLIDALPTLINAVPHLIESVIDGLQYAIPLLVECVTNIVLSIGDALPDAISALVEELPEIIQMLVDALMELVPKLVDSIINIVFKVAEALPEIIEAIIEILPSLIDTIISGLLALIPMLIECVLQLVLAIVQALPDIVMSIVALLPSLIGSIIEGLIACIPDLLVCILDIILAIVEYLPEIILNIIAILPQLIGTIIVALIDCIPMLIQCVLDLVIAIVQALPDIIVRIIQILPTLIASIVSGLLDTIPQLITCVLKMVVAIVKALPSIFLTIVTKLVELVISLAQSVKNLWPKFKEAAREWISKIWTGIKEKWSNLISNITSFFKQIPTKIKEAIGDIAEVGKNLVKGIWNGISDATQWILDKIKGFGKKVLNGLKSFFGISSPSKLFRDAIGKNLVEGLAEGIEENSILAINAAKSMAKDIRDVDYHFDGFDGFDDNHNYDNLVAKMQNAVVQFVGETGRAIGESYSSTNNSVTNNTTSNNSYNPTLNFYQPVQTPSQAYRVWKKALEVKD